jgi:hypothetical protein
MNKITAWADKYHIDSSPCARIFDGYSIHHGGWQQSLLI